MYLLSAQGHCMNRDKSQIMDPMGMLDGNFGNTYDNMTFMRMMVLMYSFHHPMFCLLVCLSLCYARSSGFLAREPGNQTLALVALTQGLSA